MTSNYLKKEADRILEKLENSQIRWQNSQPDAEGEIGKSDAPTREMVVLQKMEQACQRIHSMPGVTATLVDQLFDSMIADYLDILERQQQQLDWDMRHFPKTDRDRRLEEEAIRGDGFYMTTAIDWEKNGGR